MKFGDIYVSEHSPCFIIAEVGQNHQGCLETAKRLILAAKECGANCVKFQKSCIPEKFNAAALSRPYDSPHSWGKTYGDHKRHLEFSDEQFLELQKYAADVGILFTASACDRVSVDKLADMSVPFIKIGSGDSNNLPLIEYAASKNVPLIISTGMIDKYDVEKIYETMMNVHEDFALLHCVSSYPTPYKDCNLNVIKEYKKSFDCPIGYSGHEIGITVTLAAVAVGAVIVERHLTLDKTLKGSDHCCSLEPAEMTEMIKQIRIVESALGNEDKWIQPSEESCIRKLQKSLTTRSAMKKGYQVKYDDIMVKVTEPQGINAKDLDLFKNRVLLCDKGQDEPFFRSDFIEG